MGDSKFSDKIGSHVSKRQPPNGSTWFAVPHVTRMSPKKFSWQNGRATPYRRQQEAGCHFRGRFNPFLGKYLYFKQNWGERTSFSCATPPPTKRIFFEFFLCPDIFKHFDKTDIGRYLIHNLALWGDSAFFGTWGGGWIRENKVRCYCHMLSRAKSMHGKHSIFLSQSLNIGVTEHPKFMSKTHNIECPWRQHRVLQGFTWTSHRSLCLLCFTDFHPSRLCPVFASRVL